MFTIALSKVVHGNLEFKSRSHLGEGILFEAWTVGHDTPKAQYRNYTTYFDTPAEVKAEIIRRSARDMERNGWKVAEADN